MIKFGTDGWRGEIARDFTFKNLQLVALATARYLKKNFETDTPTVVIGYDTRFLSRQFAEETAKVMAWQGVTVHLTDSIASTPQVSFHTKQKAAQLGVVITASHNPAEYSGFKLKADFGGPATPDQIADLESELKRIWNRPPKINFKEFSDYLDNKLIRLFDAQESYLRHLKKKMQLENLLILHLLHTMRSTSTHICVILTKILNAFRQIRSIQTQNDINDTLQRHHVQVGKTDQS